MVVVCGNKALQTLCVASPPLCVVASHTDTQWLRDCLSQSTPLCHSIADSRARFPCVCLPMQISIAPSVDQHANGTTLLLFDLTNWLQEILGTLITISTHPTPSSYLEVNIPGTEPHKTQRGQQRHTDLRESTSSVWHLCRGQTHWRAFMFQGCVCWAGGNN